MRQYIDYPESQDSWNNLPKDFLEYLDFLDEIREEELKKVVIDPLYPSYEYEWSLDSEIPLRTVLEYWNTLDKELPDPIHIFNEIHDCIAETSYDDYVSSFYSY